MRHPLAILAACVAWSVPAVAQERTMWSLVMNEVAQGDIELVLDPDEGAWVEPAALERAGMQRVPEGRRKALFEADEKPWVSLNSLAPLVQFQLDEEHIQLTITADPSLFTERDIALTNPRPAGWRVRSNATAFLNYSAQWSPIDGYSGYAEAATRLFGSLLETSVVVGTDGRVTPGLTSWTIEQVGARRRWIVGDAIGRPTPLGSAPVVGGFSLTTATEVDPYYIAYPSPSIQGAVRTPSIADVYVDGRLATTVSLAPGRFAFSDLPIEAGLGSVDVVIRDAFGREQRMDIGFYLSNTMLKRGEHEYNYLVGLEREVIDAKVNYGRLVGTAFHRYGIADAVTIGAQAEGAEGIISIGMGFQARVWRLGQLELETLASRESGAPVRWARTGRYFFQAGIFSTDLRGTWIGPGFSNLYLEPALLEQIFVDASASIGLWRLGSLSATFSKGTDSDFMSRLGRALPDLLGRVYRPPPGLVRGADRLARAVRLSYSVNLMPRVQFAATATRHDTVLRAPYWTGTGSVNIALGGRTIASVVTSVDDQNETRTSFNMQRSLPLGPGYGYRIDAETEEPYRSTGTFEVQTRRALIGVRASGAQGEETDTVVNFAGSVVGIGGRVELSRPVTDAFALVRVPNARGVRVMANHQLAGRTNRRGTLFVPDLRSYLSNPIEIEQDDVPVEMRLGAIKQEIALPYRGGAVVRFEAETIRAIAGRLAVGKEAPAYGTVTMDVGGKPVSSPLNQQGEFYFEDVPAGEYVLTATWSGRTCQAKVTVPAGTQPLTDLGAVACTEPK